LDLTPRRQIAVFLILVFALGYAGQIYLIKAVGTVYSPLIFLLMWIPGGVGLLCARLFGLQWKDLTGTLPLEKYWLLAYAVPAAAAILLLIVSVGAGIGVFNVYSGRALARILLFTPTLGVLISVVTALGEELGWRGFLHTRLIKAGIQWPYIMTGLMWAAWYWPMIAFADYAPSTLPLLSLAVFTITIISFSVFLGWLRSRSHSLWPAVLAHAVHNTFIHSVYPGLYKAGPLDTYFGGECGFILAIIYLLLAIYILKVDEDYL
jgi:membrane protease YdiL (CAAX protease family)